MKINKVNKKEHNWVVTVKEFMEHYNISSSAAYEKIHAKGFPSMKVGPRSYRVDLNKTDEFFKKFYN